MVANHIYACTRTALVLLSLISQSALSFSQNTTTSFFVPAADLNIDAQKRHEFAMYDSNYFREIIPRLARSKALSKELFKLEKEGKSTACSHQIKYEVDWLLGSTADFKRIDQRLDDLQHSLSDSLQQLAAGQDATDGSWGACSTEWFFKLNAFFDAIQNLPEGNILQYKPVFLDRINNPEKLTAYLTSICTSNIPKNGIDNRRELNESLSSLLRLIINNKPAGYAWHPQLKAAIIHLVLNNLRNTETGYWGEHYINGDSSRFVDDLSITFHIISYLHGEVSGWGKMLAHTLAVKNMEYPVGWLHNKAYENHHNMDVVTLFKLGWQYATPDEKQQIQAAIQDMLDWCLTKSLQPDGAFVITDDDDSVEEGTYFGVSFLCRIGYFDTAKRFWTAQEFDGAEQMRKKIIANILQHRANGSAGGTYYYNALEQLGYRE